jgi:hypothetical protein
MYFCAWGRNQAKFQLEFGIKMWLWVSKITKYSRIKAIKVAKDVHFN